MKVRKLRKLRRTAACIIAFAMLLQAAGSVRAYAFSDVCEVSEAGGESAAETEDIGGHGLNDFIADEAEYTGRETEYTAGAMQDYGTEIFNDLADIESADIELADTELPDAFLPESADPGSPDAEDEDEDGDEDAVYGDGSAYDASPSQTEVKDRGSFNTGWAFAVTAAAEASMIASGNADTSTDYSEHGLAYFMYSSPADDPLGLTAGDRNILPEGETYCDAGGDPVYAMMMLSGWKGMQDETLMPYGEVSADASYPDEYCYTDEAVLKQGFIYNIHSNPELVKEAVMRYGGATIELPGEHFALIAGWDDNHAMGSTDQSQETGSVGAWLVKDSRGKSYGEGGYRWIAYDNEGTGPNSVAVEMIPADTYDHNFHYDGTAGSRTNVYESSGNGTLASGGRAGNIYHNTTGSAQLIEAVSIGIRTTGTDCSIQIYTSDTAMSDPADGTAALEIPVTGRTAASGLYCIDLPEPVYVPDGAWFSVVAELTNERSSAIELFTDKTIDLKDGSRTVLSFENRNEAGQSFVCTRASSAWADWAKTGSASSSWTFRIKAFTSDTEDRNGEEEPEDPQREEPGEDTGEEEPGTGDTQQEEDPAQDQYPDSVYFNSDTRRIKKGDKIRLRLLYEPSDRSIDGLHFNWTSDSTAVVSVSKAEKETEAVITARSAGDCTVSVSCRELPQLNAECYVEVYVPSDSTGGGSSGEGSSGGGSGGGSSGGGGSGSSGGPGVSGTAGSGASGAASGAYAPNWYQGSDKSWYLRGNDLKPLKSAWVCDDTADSSRSKWYLLDAEGRMVTAPLLQDASGNFYSMETQPGADYGMMRHKNGYYDPGNGQKVYLEFEQSREGAFGAIRNKEGIEALRKYYGVTAIPAGTGTVYTSTLNQ